MKKYLDTTLSPKERATALLAEMTLQEKAYQLSAEMLFTNDSTSQRDYKVGNARNPSHFIHWNFEEKKLCPKTTREVVQCINNDVKRSKEANRFGIPVLLHEEALHGAQWGMGSCFPQPIGLASTFDDTLVEEVADCIGKECHAVGVRQVLSPVINICRDSRWGRTMETFGEDVLLTSNLGVAMCKGFEQNGVIATPKHFVDNYGDGGRDSNPSHSSERELREVYLKPFERCIKEGKAKSIMTAYNLVNGLPCACNPHLLKDILREEWGFDGFVVSDYSGVEGIHYNFLMTDTIYKAQALAMNNGHNVTLPWHCHENILQALDEGLITEEGLDTCLLPLLTQKIRVGLLDEPYANEEEAVQLIRNDKAKALALKAAKESIVLLKNEHCLPLTKSTVKRIGVLGESAKKVPVGENYSGPYGGWYAEDAKTPLQALEGYLDGIAEVVFIDSDQIDMVKSCDAVLYFTSVIEGEGMDRCDLKLPKTVTKKQQDNGGFIVDKREVAIYNDQEADIQTISTLQKNTIVVLLNGAPIDMSNWIDNVAAVVEAWYPGEQGAIALAEMLFGEYSPSGKLPITFPRSIGQLPLYYAHKPSGRGYAYNENDGSPLYPFGYGLSYTQFKTEHCSLNAQGLRMSVHGEIQNVGNMDGAEVLQVYIRGTNCGIVRPVKELKGYRRVEVKRQQTVNFEIPLDKESFYFYDSTLQYGAHDSDYEIMLGTSSNDISHRFHVKVKDGVLQL